jgi:quercetin dioxygenase-like cupin family protein
MKRTLGSLLMACMATLVLLHTTATAQSALVVKPLVEKKVAELPSGPLFWRLENFPSLAQAQAAAGPTGLAAQSGDKFWLFTLAPPGGTSQGGSKVAEVGPIMIAAMPEYLLRINEGSGAPGSVSNVHTHPGSEAFYVVAGETTQQTPQGVIKVSAGQSMPGQGAGIPMQVSSSGSTNLHSLVMFVVDPSKPFSTPAKFP